MKRSLLSFACSLAFVSCAMQGIDWMRKFPPHTRVRDLPLIPGTNTLVRFNDVGSSPGVGKGKRFEYIPGFECGPQVHRILSTGIRYFDLFLSTNEARNQFAIFRQSIPWIVYDNGDRQHHVSASHMMVAFGEFLSKNPTETIFLSVKIESNSDATNFSDVFCDAFTDLLYQVPSGDVRLQLRTLAELKGRVVLLTETPMLTQTGGKLGYVVSEEFSFTRLFGSSDASATIRNYFKDNTQITTTMRGLKIDQNDQYYYHYRTYRAYRDITDVQLKPILEKNQEPINRFLGVLVLGFNTENLLEGFFLDYINRVGDSVMPPHQSLPDQIINPDPVADCFRGSMSPRLRDQTNNPDPVAGCFGGRMGPRLLRWLRCFRSAPQVNNPNPVADWFGGSMGPRRGIRFRKKSVDDGPRLLDQISNPNPVADCLGGSMAQSCEISDPDPEADCYGGSMAQSCEISDPNPVADCYGGSMGPAFVSETRSLGESRLQESRLGRVESRLARLESTLARVESSLNPRMRNWSMVGIHQIYAVFVFLIAGWVLSIVF